MLHVSHLDGEAQLYSIENGWKSVTGSARSLVFKVELVGQLGISHQSLSADASAMERRDLLPSQSSRFGTRTAWWDCWKSWANRKRDDTKGKRQPGKSRRQKRKFLLQMYLYNTYCDPRFTEKQQKSVFKQPVVNLVGYTECVTLKRQGHLLNRTCYIGITI